MFTSWHPDFLARNQEAGNKRKWLADALGAGSMEEQVAETRIELSGWHAVAALVLILAVSGIRVYMRFQSVSEEGREAVRQYLVKDYEGLGPAALAKRVAAYRAGFGDLPAPPAAEPNVEVSHLGAHGWSDSMIVRSEVDVDGGP